MAYCRNSNWQRYLVVCINVMFWQEKQQKLLASKDAMKEH